MAQQNTQNKSDVVSLGMQNLDKLLSERGLPFGNVGMLATSPESSNFTFLRNMFVENSDHGVSVFTNQRTEDDIESSIDSLKDDVAPNVVDITRGDYESVIDKLQEVDADDTSLVIIDCINAIGDVSHQEFPVGLRKIAQEKNIVVMLHYIEKTENNQFDFDFPMITYNCDFIFSLLKRRREKSIRQQFVLTKFPDGTSMNEEETSTPFIEIEFTETNLSVDSSDRI